MAANPVVGFDKVLAGSEVLARDHAVGLRVAAHTAEQAKPDDFMMRTFCTFFHLTV